jgi:hypothetical protein
MTTLPNTVDPSGKIMITQGPAPHPGFIQNIQGGLIEASASKTASSIAEQASHAAGLGVTMRGSGRKTPKKRFSFLRGGGVLDAHPPSIPQAGSIPGVSHDNVHLGLMNNLNQMKTSGVYDNLANATPYKVGGMRLRDEPEYPFGGRKRSRKVKKDVRLRKRRSNRRNRRSNVNRTRRGGRHHR